MSAPTARGPAQTGGAADCGASRSQLLIDGFLPSYDLAVVHARVFRAPPDGCFAAARSLDLFEVPLIRTLLDLRGLPKRLAGALTGKGNASEASRRTFRLDDMVGLGWILLGDTPGVEMVLGQVSRPWKPVATSTGAPLTPDEFATFDEPGFAKIAVSLRVDPYGRGSSILTVETRVALTDDESRRRFRRYWFLISPFSDLIRRMSLRVLATKLASPEGPELSSK